MTESFLYYELQPVLGAVIAAVLLVFIFGSFYIWARFRETASMPDYPVPTRTYDYREHATQPEPQVAEDMITGEPLQRSYSTVCMRGASGLPMFLTVNPDVADMLNSKGIGPVRHLLMNNVQRMAQTGKVISLRTKDKVIRYGPQEWCDELLQAGVLVMPKYQVKQLGGISKAEGNGVTDSGRSTQPSNEVVARDIVICDNVKS